jgi:hypothetical protein
MNTNLLNIIKQITAQYGEGILGDAARLKGIVNDLAKAESKEDRVAFGRAVEQGFYHELKRAAPQDRVRIKPALVSRLQIATGFDAPRCAAAVDLLEAAMTGSAAPPNKTVPKKSKKTALKIAGAIGILCIIALLRELKDLTPLIFMNMGLKASEERKKNSLPAALPVLESGWERIHLSGIGSIDIPSSMERDAGLYADIADDYYEYHDIDNDSIIFQQKGLNELTKAGFQTYARVIISTRTGNPGDFASLYFILPQPQADEIDEIKEFDAQMRTSTTSGLAVIGIKILSWKEAALVTINGMSCIHFSYTRQLHDRPVVLVHNYLFQNIDRMYQVTLSYQLEKESDWKDDFENIIHSFRITDIKNELE